MAPKKKRKAAAANPARGFATVSVPSRPKATEASSSTQDVPNVVEKVDADSEAAVKPGKVAGSENAEKSLKHLTSEELEEHFENAELELLLDEKATKIKAEALRQANKLTSERRLLRQQADRVSSASWLAEEFVGAIIDHVPSESNPHSPKSTFVNNVAASDSELLLKTWTLELVLRHLGLPEIEGALRHFISTSLTHALAPTADYLQGMHDVLDWYASNTSSTALLDYDATDDATNSAAFEEQSLHSVSDADADNDGKTSQPSVPEPSMEAEFSANDAAVTFTQVLPDVDDDDDPSKFLQQFIQLKSALFEVGQLGKTFQDRVPKALTARCKTIESRLSKLQNDVLFDHADAEYKWKTIQQDLEIEAARQRKRDQIAGSRSDRVEQAESAGAAHENDGDSMLGGMFASEDVTQDDAFAEQNVSHIKLIDYGSWTGAQPKRLLEEAYKGEMSSQSPRFKVLLKTSHSARLTVTVHWLKWREPDEASEACIPDGVFLESMHSRWSLTMLTLATASIAQAEAMLCTTLLFLADTSGSSPSKMSQRLPKVWRAFYDDMREKLVARTREKDIQDLKRLRTVINDLSKDERRSVPNGVKPTIPTTDRDERSSGADFKQYSAYMSPEQAQQAWQTRSQRDGYQQLLPVRQSLPVHDYKTDILATIESAQIVLVCADTGAGKSTQIPSYVLEHELLGGRSPRILVTQPRRISAISIARRVSEEIGEGKNDIGTEKSLIGYAVRLESKISQNTRLTFATTGVLLRMLENSHELDSLDYLILDEVHERTMEMDLLFIALKRLRSRRQDLKIILMSATVNAEKFAAYFDGCPIMSIPGRTFPVEVKYLEDAVEETLDMVEATTRKTESSAFNTPIESDDEQQVELSKGDLSMYSPKTRSTLAFMEETRIDFDLVHNLAVAIATKRKFKQYSKAILIFMPGIAEIRRLRAMLLDSPVFQSGWSLHMLHSSFSTEDLVQAFAPPPRGQRKIVIATNIAETGVTIPDVTAVIDSCKEKIMRFDERRQLSRLTEGFVSRSSARQRRGRAARVQEGLCFHLVTKHRFENSLMEQSTPEMLRLSLQEPILTLKAWDMGVAEDTLLAAIDPPTTKNIRRALDKLRDVGALNAAENLTQLGKLLSKLPLDVSMGKLAIFGVLLSCLDPVLTIIACLSSKSPFLPDKSSDKDPRLPFARGDSDMLTLYNAYQGWYQARANGQAPAYCRRYHINALQMLQIEEQKVQLMVYLSDARILHLDEAERSNLRVSRNSKHGKTGYEVPRRYNENASDIVMLAVIAMAFYPKLMKREGKGYRNIHTNQQLKVGPSSINKHAIKPPKWMCFQEAMQAKSGSLNAQETSMVPEVVIVLLLGEPEFKLFSGVITIDGGRLRFSIKSWKQMAALQRLRENVADGFDRCLRTPGLVPTTTDKQWFDLLITALEGPSYKQS